MDSQRPESIRWLILVCMFGLGLMQAVGWMTYSGNPELVSQYYGFQNASDSIYMLLNWGPIMYLPVAPVVGWVTMKHTDSLWLIVLIGACLTAAGLILRLVPNIVPGISPTSQTAWYCINIGQALNGAAGPTNCVTPSLVAATWFPPQERTFATSTIYAIQMAGPSVGFLCALLVHEDQDLVMLMVAEATAAVVVVFVWVCLPRRPKHPPSASQGLRQTHDLTACVPVSCRRWISAWSLLSAGGMVIGVFQTWSPSLPTQLNGILPGAVLKWFSIFTGVASLLGNFAASLLTEKLGLQKRLGSVIVLALLVQFVAYLAFAFLLPDSPLPGGGGGSAPFLMLLLILGSAAEGIMAPIMYELSAELTYPYPESLSGAVFSWLLNAFALILLVIFPLLPVSYGSLTMVVTCVVGFFGMRVVKDEYPRRSLDEQAGCGSSFGLMAAAAGSQA